MSESVQICPGLQKQMYQDKLSERRRLQILFLKTRTELEKIQKDMYDNDEDVRSCWEVSYNNETGRDERVLNINTKYDDDNNLDHSISTLFDLIREKERDLDILAACYEMNTVEGEKLLFEIKQKQKVKNHIMILVHRRLIEIKCQKMCIENEQYKKTHTINNIIE